jgi:hypothetical protein
VVVPVVAVAVLSLVVVGCGDGKSVGVDTPANSDPSADVAAAIPGMDFTERDGVTVTPTNLVTPTAPVAPTGGFIHSEGALDLVLGDAARAGMETISDGLGYVLVPDELPAAFTLTMARLVDVPGAPLATVFYESRGRRLSLSPDIPDGPVWVAVRAELSTKWITPEELVVVAESMLRIK